jgi:iron complex outermembrane receptor protein
LSGIPASAIERIEVLPATAGGIYGGSATGGVINVILKRDFSGFDIEANFGQSFDADNGLTGLSVTGGFGFGPERRTRVTFNASHSEGEPLFARDRDFAQRQRQWLLATNPSAILNTGRSPPLGSTTNFCAYDPVFTFGCAPGTMLVLDNGTPFNASLGSVPYGYAGPAVDAGAGLLPGAGEYNLDVADFGDALLRTPTSDSAWIDVRQELTDNLDAYLNIAASRAESAFSRNGTSPLSVVLLAAHPSNPFQQDIYVKQPIYGVPQTGNAVAENYNVLGGAILRLPHDWSVMLEHSWVRATTESVSGGRLTDSGYDAASALALQDGIAHPYDLSSFLVPPQSATSPSSELQATTLRASGPFISLPGGQIGWTLALEHRADEFGESISADGICGSVCYRFHPAVDRETNAAYLEARLPFISPEMNVPIARLLELRGAVRWDEYNSRAAGRYSGISASPDGPFPVPNFQEISLESTNYSLGLSYEPFEGLVFRSSFSTGFLPPLFTQSAPQTTGPVPEFVVQCCFLPGGDPLRGNTPVAGDILATSGGNPDIQPEESESWSLGFVWQPPMLDGLRFSLDYVAIEKTNEVFANVTPGLLVANEAAFPGRIMRGPNLGTDPVGWAGPITGWDVSPINLAHSSVGAFDAQLDYEWESAFGAFHAYAVVTQQTTFERQVHAQSPNYDSVGYEDGPLEWRGNGGLLWSLGAWTAGWNAQFYDEYSVRLADPGGAGLNATRVLNQGSETIPHQIYHDLSLAYRFADERAQIRLGVQNVFNEYPPVVAYNGVQPGQDGTYSNYGDPRLRRFTLAMRYSF